MQLSQFFKKYYFHDSSIEKIHYDADKGVCTIEVEFCNYMQEGYQEGEPEITLANLVFKGVQWVEMGEDQGLFSEDDTMSCEILTVEQLEDRGPNCWQFANNIYEYKTRNSMFGTVRLCAEDVEWQALVES